MTGASTRRRLTGTTACCLLVLTCAFATGCSGTSLLVVVDGDLELGYDVDGLVIGVWSDGAQLKALRFELSTRDELPESLEIVASDSTPASVEVRVMGLLGPDERLEAARLVEFQRGRRVEERICLLRRCLDGGDASCARGACDSPDGDGDADADVEADVEADAETGQDADSDADGDAEADRDRTVGPPGSRCFCDDECESVDTNEGICVLGVCMTLATSGCTGLGSTEQCAPGSRCWGAAAFPGVSFCWPDCASYECASQCDADGSCVPTIWTSCDPDCGLYCVRP
jgi:hypothetical protein